MLLAGAIKAIHGDVVISRETSGIHLNFASPKRLELDGEIELQKKHLALNADKYCGTGPFKDKKGSYDRERSANCMKSGKGYLVKTLLAMEPLEKRGYKPNGNGSVLVKPPAYLIDDGKGNRIPDHPGQTIPVDQLEEDHPCVQFIRSRDYDPVALVEQFRCAFCYAEAPESKEIGRFYRRLPGDWKDTAQGRLIFYCDILGVQVGWQARILERIYRGRKQHYHPYAQEWEDTHEYRGGKWVVLPHLAPQQISFSSKIRKWDPSKYKTAWGAARNEMVMGFDAALRWNKEHGIPDGEYVGFCSEGPLDAGRIKAPCMAYLGKYFSQAQAVLVAKYFKHLGFLRDKDDAADKTLEYLKRNLSGRAAYKDFDLPLERGQDPGDLHPNMAELLVRKCLNEFDMGGYL